MRLKPFLRTVSPEKSQLDLKSWERTPWPEASDGAALVEDFSINAQLLVEEWGVSVFGGDPQELGGGFPDGCPLKPPKCWHRQKVTRPNGYAASLACFSCFFLGGGLFGGC